MSIQPTRTQLTIVGGGSAQWVPIPARDFALAEWLRRVSASQELTVETAVAHDPDLLPSALATDPACGRLGFDTLVAVRDEILVG
jgi:hypothetical protein